MRLSAAAAVLSVVALAAGCSACSAPTAPAFASVAGNWTGTIQLAGGQGMGNGGVAGSQLALLFQMSLMQSGGSVSGTYSVTSGGTGLASGAVTGIATPDTFSGTFTWNPAPDFSPECKGSFVASGAAGTGAVTWTSPASSAPPVPASRPAS